jgi:hypothetical protein
VFLIFWVLTLLAFVVGVQAVVRRQVAQASGQLFSRFFM